MTRYGPGEAQKQTRRLSSEESANRDAMKKTFEPSDRAHLKVKGMHTHTVSSETKSLLREKKIRPLYHNNGRTVTKTKTLHSERWVYVVSSRRLWFHQDRLHGAGTATTAQEKTREDTESYYYDSAPPPLLSGFHSSPITSSNDSNVSRCTVTARLVWKWQTDVEVKSDAVKETAMGFCAARRPRDPNASHLCSLSIRT